MSLVYCSNCYQDVAYAITECDVVCRECGLVLDSGVIQDAVTAGLVKASTYNRIAYFNENLAMLLLQGQGVPLDFLLLIEKEAQKKEIYGRPSGFTKVHIQCIMRNLKIPQVLQEVYRTKPRPQNRYKSVPVTKISSKYGDRWRWIKQQLSPSYAVPQLDSWVLCAVRNYFVQTFVAHEHFKTNKSHYPCYYFVIIKIMQLIDFLRGTKLVNTYTQHLPLPSMTRIRAYHSLWNQIQKYLGWIDEKKYPETSSSRDPRNSHVIEEIVKIPKANGKDVKRYKIHYLTVK